MPVDLLELRGKRSMIASLSDAKGSTSSGIAALATAKLLVSASPNFKQRLLPDPRLALSKSSGLLDQLARLDGLLSTVRTQQFSTISSATKALEDASVLRRRHLVQMDNILAKAKTSQVHALRDVARVLGNTTALSRRHGDNVAGVMAAARSAHVDTLRGVKANLQTLSDVHTGRLRQMDNALSKARISYLGSVRETERALKYVSVAQTARLAGLGKAWEGALSKFAALPDALSAVRARVTPAWLRHQVVRSAMRARVALMDGFEHWEAVVDEFVLLLGLGHPREWRESACTALAGNWLDLLWGGLVSPEESVTALRREAQEIHEQAQPLWDRKAQYARVVLLETPLGHDGFTVSDLQPDTGSPDPADVVLQQCFSERVTLVLEKLSPRELDVALAWAAADGRSWTEAASLAGVPSGEAEAAGVRVKRKLNRLGRLHTSRKAGAALTRERLSVATTQ
ncbi:hypothetical protein [Streptomyces sp. NPDC048663]|uniref:hypothetical protein n=1 Tax=Streptomyces sp. NPDC048663 TaxID=3155638 RepID=UPI0034225C10